MSLGQILKDNYGLKEEDLSKALNLQKDLGGDIGHILVQTGTITDSQLAEALSRCWAAEKAIVSPSTLMMLLRLVLRF